MPAFGYWIHIFLGSNLGVFLCDLLSSIPTGGRSGRLRAFQPILACYKAFDAR